MANAKEKRELGSRPIWSNGLKCCWLSWTAVDDGILRLNLPESHCCDMRGAIKAAEGLCPGVWRIDTYAGGKPDIMYLKQGREWGVVGLRDAQLLFNCYPAVK